MSSMHRECLVFGVRYLGTTYASTMDARSKRRGGARTGAGRKKLDKASSKQMDMRISEDTYGRWKELKTLRRAKTDAELLEYLLDLAASADQDSSFRYVYVKE